MEFGNLIYKIRINISEIFYIIAEWINPYDDIGTLGRPTDELDDARSGSYKINGGEYE